MKEIEKRIVIQQAYPKGPLQATRGEAQLHAKNVPVAEPPLTGGSYATTLARLAASRPKKGKVIGFKMVDGERVFVHEGEPTAGVVRF
jgi:hypothetical protein